MAREPLEIGTLLRECVEKLAPQAQEAGVALEVDVPEKLCVNGDADQLSQVFVNLVDNGIAHTPPGGRVAVAARVVSDRETMHKGARDRAENRVKQAVNVTVTDSGEGIPPGMLPRIFERFYRADKARRRRGGAGLGLAIAKEIVTAHGGTITAESVVGLGSKLTVRLPVADREASC
jgi:two-component system sensor histidine kinase BaeS